METILLPMASVSCSATWMHNTGFCNRRLLYTQEYGETGTWLCALPSTILQEHRSNLKALKALDGPMMTMVLPGSRSGAHIQEIIPCGLWLKAQLFHLMLYGDLQKCGMMGSFAVDKLNSKIFKEQGIRKMILLLMVLAS